MPSMQNFWHLFRCLRKVPPELYGRYDGWPGLGWDFSSTRQHLCHRHAGSSPEEVFSVFENPMVEESELILSQIYLRLFCWMTNCLSQVSPEDIGFWCFLIAFIFVVLSLVRHESTFWEDHLSFSQVAYCAVQTTQFFTFYAGTAGGPQLRLTQESHLHHFPTIVNHAQKKDIKGINIWAFSV